MTNSYFGHKTLVVPLVCFRHRRRRFDRDNQGGITIILGDIYIALHPFSGFIKLADLLAYEEVALLTSGNKFTVAWSYDVENRHHAHNCSGLDLSARAFSG